MRGKRKTTSKTTKTAAEPKRRGRPRKQSALGSALEKADVPQDNPPGETQTGEEAPKATSAKPVAPAKAEKAEKAPKAPKPNTAMITKENRSVQRIITDTVGMTVRVASDVEPPAKDAVVSVSVDNGEKFQLVAKFIQPRKAGGHTVWLFLRTRDNEGKKMQQGPRWRACRLRTCSLSL